MLFFRLNVPNCSYQRYRLFQVYIYVMQAVFYPDEKIDRRFDLKGCMAGRFQDPTLLPPGYPIVLKDYNFYGRKINLGEFLHTS